MITKSRISAWTAIRVPDLGTFLNVPMHELDNEHLEQLADTATALLMDRLRARLTCSKCGRTIPAGEPHQPGLGDGVLCVRCVREQDDD